MYKSNIISLVAIANMWRVPPSSRFLSLWFTAYLKACESNKHISKNRFKVFFSYFLLVRIQPLVYGNAEQTFEVTLAIQIIIWSLMKQQKFTCCAANTHCFVFKKQINNEYILYFPFLFFTLTEHETHHLPLLFLFGTVSHCMSIFFSVFRQFFLSK